MGVFVPCMLSIIGLVLFLRLGWAIGQAGVMGVLLMFSIGGLMALLTVLSLSAMATNGRIAGGGTYYLISRSVGPELGGAIGCVFYCANTIGIAFYLQGFAEAFLHTLGVASDDPSSYWLKVGAGTAVLAIAAIVAIVGSALYAKCAALVFSLQTLAITWGFVCLLVRPAHSWPAPSGGGGNGGGASEMLHFTGPSMKTLQENMWPDFDGGFDALAVFGIVFPAMTGIMAGTNMSGVLRRPDLSIPRGELSALACSLVTYAILVVALGCSVKRDTLRHDYMILADIASPR
jgi:amino acid transporter